MESIYRQIEHWHEMTFEENPYGEKLPFWLLNSHNCFRSQYQYEPITLHKLKQDGNILNLVYNTTKNSKLEDIEIVCFSEIFKKLKFQNKLCPSNYINEVTKQAIANNQYGWSRTDFQQFVGRQMRAFASHIREESCEETIFDFLIEYNKANNVDWVIIKNTYEQELLEDTKNKTDILLKETNTGKTIRIWSFQVTNRGIEKTSNRLRKGCVSGINLLIPFDMKNKECCKNFFGWFLYKKMWIEKAMFLALENKHCTYSEFINKLNNDSSILTTPLCFEV